MFLEKIRFRGKRSHSGYAAILHLARIYSYHLSMEAQEAASLFARIFDPLGTHARYVAADARR